MAGTLKYTEDWQTLPWQEIERNVFRLQQRIYQAASWGDVKRVHACAQWTCWRFIIEMVIATITITKISPCCTDIATISSIARWYR